MNRYPLWKYILVLTVLLLGLVYSMPNIFGESPAVQITTAKATTKLDPAMLFISQFAVEPVFGTTPGSKKSVSDRL